MNALRRHCSRCAIYIAIHHKRHEILHCASVTSGSSVAGTQVRAPPLPQVKTGMSNAFRLAFAAGESACHRWPKSFSFSEPFRSAAGAAAELGRNRGSGSKTPALSCWRRVWTMRRENGDVGVDDEEGRGRGATQAWLTGCRVQTNTATRLGVKDMTSFVLGFLQRMHLVVAKRGGRGPWRAWRAVVWRLCGGVRDRVCSCEWRRCRARKIRYLILSVRV
jgi:hypothetical protein